MLKTADIDRFEQFACTKPGGSARVALALTLALHALVICGLAAISIYVAPKHVATGELETTFVPAPPRPADLSLIENVSKEKPLRGEAATAFQIRELPNDPTRLEIAEVTFRPIGPEHPEFSGEFLPKPESPAETRVSKPPVKKQTRPAAKAKPPVFSQARVRSTSRPSYPESARRKGIEGTANVRLSLDSSGNVSAASISKSSGNSALDAAAVKAAKRWKFSPATRDGRPAPSKMIVPIRFRLN